MKIVQQFSPIERFDMVLSIGKSGTSFATCSVRRKPARPLYKPLTPSVANKHVKA